MSTVNQKLNTPSVYRYFLILITINIVLVALAIFLYNGAFKFWTYPFSYAGDAFTQDGFANSTSSLIYSFAMLVSGIIMIYLARHYQEIQNKRRLLKAFLSSASSLGFIIASLAPDDAKHNFHVLGSALFIGSLWLLTTVYLVELARFRSKATYYSLQAVLQIPIFAYAITYFANLDPLSYVVQKIAILGLFVTLLYSTYALDKKE